MSLGVLVIGRLVVVAGVALSLVACGTNKPVAGPPSTAVTTTTAAPDSGNAVEWAGKICSAAAPELKLFSAEPAIDTTDSTTAKAGLIKYLDGLLAGTDRMIAGFEAAGVPTIPEGDEVSAAVVGSMTSAREKMAEGKAQLVGLDATDPAAFEAAVTKLGENLQAAVKLDPVAAIGKHPEVVKAFNTAPSCLALAKLRATPPPTP